MIRRWFAAFALAPCAVLVGACFGDAEPRPHPQNECTVHEDCAYLDDGDVCFSPARCESGRCTRRFLQNDTDCQCNVPSHCEDLGFQDYPCAVNRCELHLCEQSVVQEGPAPDDKQSEGDCELLWCDGSDVMAQVQPDTSDSDDGDPCTTDSCGDSGPVNEPLADGAICDTGDGLCYAGLCYPGCVPADPSACGHEGANEPADNNASGASQYQSGTEVCGMLDESDVDWYEMPLVDAEFVQNIMRFDFHGSPATLEICAYVDCVQGDPGGGCSNKVPGPYNTLGCCWQGAPENLSPEWDLDCSGTDDDGGTGYLSVRALGGDACETYRMTWHY